jgi:hypothetical protein
MKHNKTNVHSRSVSLGHMCDSAFHFHGVLSTSFFDIFVWFFAHVDMRARKIGAANSKSSCFHGL